MATDKKIPSNLIFNKEKFRYNTIQDVINDTGLTVGLVVETDGYNTLGDGFDAKYLITNVNEQGSILLKNGNYAKEISNSNGSKKLDKVNTIEELKSQNLKVGDVIEILGYYSADDGATHKRVIADVDDGSGVELRSGKWANIVHNGEVNVSWFGAKGDGVTDNAFILNSFISKKIKYLDKSKILDIINNDEALTLLFPEGEFLISETLYLPRGLKIKGIKSQGFGNSTRKDRAGVSVIHYTGKTKALSSVIYNKDLSIYEGTDLLELENFGIDAMPENIEIEDIEVYSDNAIVELYLNGAVLCKVTNVKLGKNKKDYKTKVACVIGNAWGSVISKNLFLSKIHGFVSFGSTGGVTLKDNYISRAGGSIDTKNEIQVYKTLYEGSVGIQVSKGNINMENNVVEHWFIPHSLEGNISINNVHIETDNAETLTSYLATGEDTSINLSGNCNGFAGKLNGLGSILLKNFGSKSIFRVSKIEIFQPIKKIIYRDNSTGTVILSGSFYSQGFYGGAKDISNLVIDDISVYKEIIHVSETGDDINWGTRETNPVKTLNRAFELAKIFKTHRIKLLTNININSDLNIYNDVDIVADEPKTINCNQFSINTENKNIKLTNIIINSTRNPTIFEVYKDLNLTLNNSTLSTTQTFFNVHYSNLKLTVDNSSNLSNVGWKYAVGKGTFSAYIGTDNRKKEIDSYPTNNELDVVYFKAINLQSNVSQLNTLYHGEKMKQEGVYNDYITYMDEKTLYDKQQRKLEQDRQLAYEEALKENPELTYEEFMSVQPMTLNLVEEPQPSENLKKFMEKYL